MRPVIVVVAYNRATSLQRLLDSLSKANYPSNGEVALVISIDKSDNDAVAEVAEKIVWNYGEKILLIRQQRLGLKKHVLLCGDLTEQYGSIIMLEDDLCVSPYFYHYTENALIYYKNDNKIAGISLYNYRINETAQRPFEPVHDGTDVYFLQLPSSWGQAWDRAQWEEFRAWYDHGDSHIEASDGLPANVMSWPKTSWKKDFVKYMVAKNKYFVYPRISLTTNFGDIGTHGRQKNNNVQVSLLLLKMDYRFYPIHSSLSIYDAHMEILPDILSKFNKKLASFDYEVDLYGTKKIEKISKEYALTSKNCAECLLSFSGDMKPHETCIKYDIHGDQFKLCRVSSLSAKKISLRQQFNNMLYDMPLLSKRKSMILALFMLLNKIKKIIGLTPRNKKVKLR